MRRGRDGAGAMETKRQRERQYSLEPHLWQWRLDTGNITTGCALHLVSSVGEKRSIFERTQKIMTFSFVTPLSKMQSYFWGDIQPYGDHLFHFFF